MAPPALVDAALQALPAGAPWGFLGWAAPVALWVGWGLTRLAGATMARPLRAARAAQGDDLHWTDEARLAWSPRRLSAVPALIASVTAVLLVPALTGALGVLPPTGRGVLIGALVLAGGGLANAQLQRRLLPGAPAARDHLRGQLAMLVLRFGHLVILAGVAAALPATPSAIHAAAVLGGLALVLAWPRGLVVGLSRLTGGLRSAPARLQQVVAAAAEAEGTAAPEVGVLAGASVNAFALPAARHLAFTEGALAHLTDNELSAVARHELGHLAETPSLQRLRSLPSALLLPLLVLKPLVARATPLQLAAALAGWVLVALLTTARVRRAFRAAEAAADAHAQLHPDEDARYGATLERIYALNRIPAVLGRGHVHPDLYDRMRACGLEPDWPRPAPPPPLHRKPALLSLVAIPGLAFAALVGLFTLTSAERVPVWPVLATAGAPHALVGHGRTRIALGDPEPGTALLELACHAQPDPYHCAETAMWLAELGRCAPAQAALAAATAASSQETGPDRGPEGALGAYLTEAATWVGRCGTDEPPPTP